MLFNMGTVFHVREFMEFGPRIDETQVFVSYKFERVIFKIVYIILKNVRIQYTPTSVH